MWRSEDDVNWVTGYRAAQDNPETATNPHEPLTSAWEDWAEGFRMGLQDVVQGYNHFPTDPKDLWPPNPNKE